VLTNERDQAFTGSATAFDTGLRFDPEGVRLHGRGGFVVSDEYGPYVYRFSAEGVRLDLRPSAPAGQRDRPVEPAARSGERCARLHDERPFTARTHCASADRKS
jgi:hypothetical protein